MLFQAGAKPVLQMYLWSLSPFFSEECLKVASKELFVECDVDNPQDEHGEPSDWMEPACKTPEGLREDASLLGNPEGCSSDDHEVDENDHS